MSIHLIKLSVGPESLSDLERWQQQRLRDYQKRGQPAELMHITRHMPKRAEELLKDGSIYWVIKGFVCARQKLVELRPVTRDGVTYCGIICDPVMVRVVPRPHRPFQGWRYLDGKDAPPDLKDSADTGDMPDHMLQELASLGLL